MEYRVDAGDLLSRLVRWIHRVNTTPCDEEIVNQLIPPLTYRRVHFILRGLRPSFSMFFRALLSLNQSTEPSLLTNIMPVPGSISSCEKLHILRSGILIHLSVLNVVLHDLYL